jgi:hypothetical protein
MSPTAPLIAFPVPVLTPIVGRPNASSLQILQQQLYQNARSIASDRGGGAYGHLALIMPADAYLLRPNAVAFIIPVSPGMLAAPAGDATSARLFEAKRVHDNATIAFTTYQAVNTALMNQILAAVERTYVQTLCDVDFGFADVLPSALLTHLKTTYGVLTGLEIETNRSKLKDPWDPSSPIETLWARIVEIRRIATGAGQAIDDNAVIALMLPMFERTGLFLHTVNAWNSMERVLQTYVTFVSHFTRANEVRLTKLSASDLGFADTHFTTTSAVKKVVPVTPPRGGIETSIPESVFTGVWHYCWSHGLSQHAVHTSASCSNPKPGHIVTATAQKRQGGSQEFRTREDRRPSNTPPA